MSASLPDPKAPYTISHVPAEVEPAFASLQKGTIHQVPFEAATQSHGRVFLAQMPLYGTLRKPKVALCMRALTEQASIGPIRTKTRASQARSKSHPYLNETTPPNKHRSQAEEEEEIDDMPRAASIERPTGGVGRPRTGGYNLRDTLGWDDKKWDQVKVRTGICMGGSLLTISMQDTMNELTDTHLDWEKTFTQQNESKMKKLKEKVSDESWPAA
jgi:hypothetical protein